MSISMDADGIEMKPVSLKRFSIAYRVFQATCLLSLRPDQIELL
jgi:hypothetical protein